MEHEENLCRRNFNKTNRCNCSQKDSCLRAGICCECLSRHLKKRQLPGCCFPNDLEPEHRSFDDFAKFVIDGKI